MEVTVNKSIEIPKTEKKKRPRIGDTIGSRVKADENAATSVVSTNYKDDTNKKPQQKSSFKKNDKPNFKNDRPKRFVRSVDDIKAGIIKSLESVGGKYVKFEDINHTEGLLVCAVIDAADAANPAPNDVYFAVVNHDRKLVYVEADNRFSVQREPSMKCSILDWLYRNEAQTIADIAFGTLEDDGVDVFTDTYIVVPEPPKKNKKNKKGNKKN